MGNISTRKSDGLVLLTLISLVLLFFLPLLVGIEKFFFDDIAFVFYPQQIFLARCLKDGVIPLWNPHICAGATPFYTHIFQGALYLINWPFLLFGSMERLCNFFWLVKAPLVFHYLLSAVFSFLLARVGLRLSRPGSFVLSIAYTFSPTMIYMATFPPEVFVQAWLPILCFFLIIYARSGRVFWLILGTIAFGISGASGDVPFVFHVVMITGLFGIGLMLLAFLSRDWQRLRRLIMGMVIIFVVGVLLCGIYWSNMLVGLRLLQEGAADDVARLSGIHQSLPPLYLITLFIPDFFGGVTSAHTWGAAFQVHLSLNDANLLGGLASLFLVFLGAFFVIRIRDNTKDTFSVKKLWWIFSGIFVVGIFTVLGRYTPVYVVLRALIPVLKMPYPLRFRSIECFALAGLMGTSVTLLKGREFRGHRSFGIFFLIFILLFAALVLIFPYRDSGRVFNPGWKHLTHLNDWAWFIMWPSLYFIIVGGILCFGIWLLKGKAFMRLLILLIIVELLFFAYGAFYYNQILNRRNRDFSATRYRGPDDHRIYRISKKWGQQIGEEGYMYRSLYSRSYFDNLAWIDGSFSMLGFDIKPLDRRFQNVLEKVTTGFPYEIRVRDWKTRFWTNMSVNRILSEEPVQISAVRKTGLIGGYRTYDLAAALPRIYFQDRWEAAGEVIQERALRENDLRVSGFCDSEIKLKCTGDMEEGGRGAGEEIDRFDRLQKANRLISADFSDPNRVELEVMVTIPAMLVMTDLWHPDWSILVDGRPRPLHRVNYLQRGLWCTSGTYRIIMEFRPESLSRGLFMTMSGILILIILIVISFRQAKSNNTAC